VTVHALDIVSTTAEEAVLEARCSKGTYVRALARDLGRELDCFGHVTALRRTRVGPFSEQDALGLLSLTEDLDVPRTLHCVEAGLMEMPRIAVDRDAAARLRRGQAILLRGADTPLEGPAYAACGGVVIAVGAIEKGELVPGRVFNLPF
jgi:tRNA pseudouridine55 synthase